MGGSTVHLPGQSVQLTAVLQLMLDQVIQGFAHGASSPLPTTGVPS